MRNTKGFMVIYGREGQKRTNSLLNGAVSTRRRLLMIRGTVQGEDLVSAAHFSLI